MSAMVSTSMLSADFGDLNKDIEMVNNSEADLFHLDIMDGVFVPNISYGFPVVKAIAKKATKPMDAHLMIVNPDNYVGEFAKLGVEWLSVHYEACTHLHRTISNIKSYNMKAGIALNPHTPISVLEDIIYYADYILIMSVNPGFGGQSFIEHSLDKISRLKDLIVKQNLNCLIEVDGGVRSSISAQLISACADILVAGNAVFCSNDPYKAIKVLHCL